MQDLQYPEEHEKPHDRCVKPVTSGDAEVEQVEPSPESHEAEDYTRSSDPSFGHLGCRLNALYQRRT